MIYTGNKKKIPDTISLSKEYLENREQEVVDMMMTLFDDDQILKAYTKDIREETERKTAMEMIKDGELSLEKIAKYVPSLSMEELRKLKTEVMQLA